MKTYWKTKDGKNIDIDEMSIDHLRNVLKMLIKNKLIKTTKKQSNFLQDLKCEFDAENYGCRD